ncbi:cupin domain-containing protein [Ideonella sp.]|uniref:cupin domain-containing protein n=1 Tax=Ideonella sp. TaxID=1929293 RepID=UPI003BB7B1A1
MNDTALALRKQLIRNIDGALAGPGAQTLSRPPLYTSHYAGLSDGMAAKKLGCAVDVVPPGQQSCPYHCHHAQEEMFIILDGEGTLRVAGERLPVRAGDVIMIPPGPEYPHQLINTSTAPLRYLSISTQEKPEICDYPDSGKTMAWAPGVKLLQRPGSNLDYWDGEP